MKKIIKVFSSIVIFIFALSVFGWMVFHVSKGDKDFGFFNGPIKSMYTFLDLFSQSVEEVKVKALPQTFIKTPENFQAVNKLDSNLIVLTTYSDTSNSRSIVLYNLKTDSILYKWRIKNPHAEHDRILNPILLPDKNIVYSFDGKSLMRIDSLSNVVWKQDSIWSHHATNLDKNGDIWVCAFPIVYYATGLYKIEGRSVFYKDNYIAKIDAKTGRILFYKSITKILAENNLADYIIKSGHLWDPIHLNDVEPVDKTTPYYQKGDVFISLRQPSTILQYRPSTGKVVKVIEGPFVAQHDVDIYDDHSIVVFNNNNYSLLESGNRRSAPKDSVRLAIAGDFYSNIIRYDYRNNSFSCIGDSVFRANKIFTYSEGLVDFLNPTTYFVEEQNTGLLWIIKDDEIIYKNILKSQHEGYHHLPNWTRIIKNYE